MINPETLAWAKMDDLLPAVVQHADTGAVLMLGYMNRDALAATLSGGHVTFFSRSKGRLWTKGETSGNHLRLTDVRVDCDGDALLVTARPIGPTCHLGTSSCFGEDAAVPTVLSRLEAIVAARKDVDPANSYTAQLLASGIKRIAQKVGEEGVETALAAVAGDRAELVSEAADLTYHLTVLLQAAGASWSEVGAELARRHEKAPRIQD